MQHLNVPIPTGLSPHDVSKLCDNVAGTVLFETGETVDVTVRDSDPLVLSQAERGIILHALALIPEAQTALAKLGYEPSLSRGDLAIIRALRERLDA